MPLWFVQPAYIRTFYTSVGAVRFYMQVRQSEYEGKARKPPGIEGNTQPDGTARRGPEGELRFGKVVVPSASRLAERCLTTGMALYIRMGKSHRQRNAAERQGER